MFFITDNCKFTSFDDHHYIKYSLIIHVLEKFELKTFEYHETKDSN